MADAQYARARQRLTVGTRHASKAAVRLCSSFVCAHTDRKHFTAHSDRKRLRLTCPTAAPGRASKSKRRAAARKRKRGDGSGDAGAALAAGTAAATDSGVAGGKRQGMGPDAKSATASQASVIAIPSHGSGVTEPSTATSLPQRSCTPGLSAVDAGACVAGSTAGVRAGAAACEGTSTAHVKYSDVDGDAGHQACEYSVNARYVPRHEFPSGDPEPWLVVRSHLEHSCSPHAAAVSKRSRSAFRTSDLAAIASPAYAALQGVGADGQRTKVARGLRSHLKDAYGVKLTVMQSYRLRLAVDSLTGRDRATAAVHGEAHPAASVVAVQGQAPPRCAVHGGVAMPGAVVPTRGATGLGVAVSTTAPRGGPNGHGAAARQYVQLQPSAAGHGAYSVVPVSRAVASGASPTAHVSVATMLRYAHAGSVTAGPGVGSHASAGYGTGVHLRAGADDRHAQQLPQHQPKHQSIERFTGHLRHDMGDDRPSSGAGVAVGGTSATLAASLTMAAVHDVASVARSTPATARADAGVAVHTQHRVGGAAAGAGEPASSTASVRASPVVAIPVLPAPASVPDYVPRLAASATTAVTDSAPAGAAPQSASA